VEKIGFLIKEASPELKSDKDIVLKAVKCDGFTFNFVDTKFINDYDVVSETVKTNGYIYTQLHSSFRKKKEILYPAVNSCPSILQYPLLSPYLDDRNVFLQAVQGDGFAIKYGTLKIQNDKEIVIKAIQNGLDFEKATIEMQNDKEIALEAVKKNYFVCGKLPDKFLSDPDVITMSTKYFPETIKDSHLKNNFEFILSLIKINDKIYNELSDDFQSNKEIVMTALINKSKFEDINSNKMKGFKQIIQDMEVFWMFKKYFMIIRGVEKFLNVNFRFQ
jgi:hypothetical protein